MVRAFMLLMILFTLWDISDKLLAINVTLNDIFSEQVQHDRH